MPADNDQPDQKPAEPTKPENGEAKESIQLPTVKHPVMVVSEGGMCWVGIPLFAVPIIEAVCLLDQAKGLALQFYKHQAGQVKLHKPGGMVQATKNFLGRLH